MGEYLLRTNALTKEFARHKAVNKVNLHVKKGSIYGFIGRNGAGKTTCMRMISGPGGSLPVGKLNYLGIKIRI